MPFDTMDATEKRFKLKYDWYQTEATVVITIIVKNLAEENLNIKYSPKSVTIAIKDEENNVLNLNLCHAIKPAECSHKLYKTKIELILRKESGIRWNTLEASIPAVSSLPANKNWDRLVKELDPEAEKNEGLDAVFQSIYQNATDEQRRAMNKSFCESKGTVLSTNWEEVGSKNVEMKPPDDVEFKKWDS